jgi:hypothetical protein
VPKDGLQADAVQKLMLHAAEHRLSEIEHIWDLTPFIDCPGDYPTRPYRFEWEREWRVLGSLSFHEQDAAFLVIPEGLHKAARSFFEDAISENTGPGYLCPYIDPNWTWDQVRAAFGMTAAY